MRTKVLLTIVVLVGGVGLLAYFAFAHRFSKGPLARAERAEYIGNVYAPAWVYATEHWGLYPPLDPRPGRLQFDRSVVHPTYSFAENVAGPLDDPKAPILFAEFDRNRPRVGRPRIPEDDDSWFYLGYVMTTEAEGMTFLEEYRKRMADGRGMAEDIYVGEGRGSGGTDTLYRLRFEIDAWFENEGIPFNKKARNTSNTPVIIERPGRHDIPGGWVMFLNHTCYFIEYPGPFPMTERFIQALDAIDPEEPNQDQPEVDAEE